MESIFDRYGAPVLTLLFIILMVMESRFQLRRRVQHRWKRVIINFAVSIPAFLLLRLMFIPLMVWLAFENRGWQIGLTYLLELPAFVEAMATVLLLDYSNYLWHVLVHRLPVIWRFHLVHHTDLDLDVTTAFRFHFGEMIGSVFFRGAAILLIGATPLMVVVYEIAFEAATAFHHSNIKMPLRLERVLIFFIVTPRMHGIHHSIVKRETDSNFAVIFSLWDRLHRTVRLNIPQHEVVIGVPTYHNENELTIGHLLKLPFTKIRPWSGPLKRPSGDGAEGRGQKTL